MAVFEESGLRFDFCDAISAYVADKPNYDGLSAVDFIVETSEEFLFIEVKNPDNKNARPEAIQQFVSDMRDDVFPIKISGKFKDSLLKELVKGKQFPKPIRCILFLEYQAIDAAQKRRLFERISSRIPKFSEESFTSVKKVIFSLSNRVLFHSDYGSFTITDIA